MLHDFFGHRIRYGNGTFVSVKRDGTTHYWVITASHTFFSEATTRKMREKMGSEMFRTTLMNSLRRTAFEIEGSTHYLPANDVLLDYDSPVFCFDQVRSCSMANRLCHIQNVHVFKM